MKLSFLEIVVLRTILNFSGDMEPGQDGKEVLAARKLNGQESSQRRHFTKNTHEVVSKVNELAKSAPDQINELKKQKEDEYTKENPLILDNLSDEEKKTVKESHVKSKNEFVNSQEDLKNLIEKLNGDYKKASEEEHEIELKQDTLIIIKKYFAEWGEKVGWLPSQDELIEKLEIKLNV